VAKKEAQARIRINRLLEQAGWRFFPDKNGPDNIICESRITKTVYAPSLDLGNDFEKAAHGFVDYLLLNLDGKPVALVEAKREGIDPLDAKEQTREYAKSLGVRHIFLSNGIIHYYWDLSHGNPTRISHLLSLEQLGEASRWNPERCALAGDDDDGQRQRYQRIRLGGGVRARCGFGGQTSAGAALVWRGGLARGGGHAVHAVFHPGKIPSAAGRGGLRLLPVAVHAGPGLKQVSGRRGQE